MAVKENQQNKKNIILEAFYNLISESGLENVSIAKIAKEINIPTSLVFYYYNNKQELIYGLIDYVFEKCISVSTPMANIKNENAKEAFEQFIEEVFSIRGVIDIDSKVYFSCVNIALRDEIAKEKFNQHTDRSKKILYENLKYFKEKGIVKCSDLRQAVDYMIVIISGLQDVLDFIEDRDKFREIVEVQKEQLMLMLKVEL